MKILMLSPYFYPHIGGVENHVLNVAKVLTKSGNSVIILTPKYNSVLKSEEDISGIKVLRFPKLSIPKFGQLIFLTWLMINKSKIGNPDVIHGHDLYSKPIRVVFPQSPYFITFHGYEGYPLDKANVESRQSVAKKVSGSIAVGHFIEKWYGIKSDFVTYGATESPVKIKERKIIFDGCFIGRLEKDTGVLTYFEALKILKEKGIDFKLVICGDGSLRRELEEVSQGNKLNVKFTGMVPNPNDFLDESKLAFVSGYLSILGAMSRGKVVVSVYDNPLKKDYLEMIPNSSKMMIISGTKEDLARNISHAVSDRSYESMINLSKDWASKQTWKNLATTYLDLYSIKGVKSA